jgi:hypothetical protein
VDLELARLPALERYKLLIGLVIPRPIAWVSTWSANGVANCAPFSFFNVISEDPPLCILSFNWRSDGEVKHTLKNIRRTGEFVVNLADEATANAMHLTGTELPETESEFAKFGLRPVPAKLVKHPRIAEAAARDGIIDPVTKRISEDLYRPVGRLFAERYCTTRQRFNLPGELPNSGSGS